MQFYTKLFFAYRAQAYLSPTQYDNLSTSSTTWASGGNTRAPRALLGSSTVNIVQRKNQQPHENVIQHDRTPPFWHKIDNRFERPAEGGGILEDQFMPSRKGDALSFMIDTIEAPSKSDLQVLTCEPFRPLASDSGRGVFDPSTIQTTDQDDNNLEGYVAVTRKETHIPSRQREAGESRRPRPRRPSSLGSYPEQDSLINWYPSRPASAETASVSLISPRTSKKIRRLPTPGQIEEDTLQVSTFCGYGSAHVRDGHPSPSANLSGYNFPLVSKVGIRSMFRLQTSMYRLIYMHSEVMISCMYLSFCLYEYPVCQIVCMPAASLD